MKRLHFIIKNSNGRVITTKAHEVEKAHMIELMGTEENYIDFVKEQYANEMLDEYDFQNAIVEFVGQEEVVGGTVSKQILEALKAQMILCIDQTGLMPTTEQITDYLEDEYGLGNEVQEYMIALFK